MRAPTEPQTAGPGHPQEEPDVERVWRALGDPTRRAILDWLATGERTTGELVERFPRLCRTAVMKHLDVLERAHLLLVRREGRLRWNAMNPMPIQRIVDRWVSKHVRTSAGAASRLKDHVESKTRGRRTGPETTPRRKR